MRGIFITTEGIDGSGKSTQFKKIVEYLIGKGKEVVTTREPGGTPISEKIRDILLDCRNGEMDRVTEMLLYAAARAQLVSQVVLPALESGKIVVCDRFVDSSYVYQGMARKLGLEPVRNVNAYALHGCEPDLTFVFDLDPAVARLRRSSVRDEDRMERESIDFHRQVREGYLALARLYPQRIKVISAVPSADEVFATVRTFLDELI